MTKITLTVACLLLPALLPAQVTGRVDRVYAQPITTTERTAVVPAKGAMIYLETDPSQLYIGDGKTAGGLLVTPPDGSWDHNATQGINLNGFRLSLGNGFSLISLGGYQFISGGGEISASGNVSQWGDPANPYIRLTGGDELGEITAFTWDAGAAEFTATITDIGAGVPSIETTDDLVSGTWTAHTATVTGPSGGSYTAVFEAVGAQAFFRAVYPSGGNAIVELLKPTHVSSIIAAASTGLVISDSDSNTHLTIGEDGEEEVQVGGDLAVTGTVTAENTLKINGAAPATSSSPGTPGQMIQSGNYLYICIATDTWRRAQIFDWE